MKQVYFVLKFWTFYLNFLKLILASGKYALTKDNVLDSRRFYSLSRTSSILYYVVETFI